MTLPGIISSLIVSLILTLLLEEGFALISGIRHRKDLLLVFLVNALTNPVVVLCYILATAYAGWSPIPVLLFLETAAFVSEALYYKAYAATIAHPFRFSALANAASFGIGLVIDIIFG
jgi:hypothetical protein